MEGILTMVSKAETYSAQTSGTVFAASILSAMLKDSWSNGNGEMATDAYMGAYLRRAIDDFTWKSNTVITTGNITQINTSVTQYATSFGPLNLHTHRYIQQSSDATGRMLLLRPEKLKIAWLQRPFVDTGLARSGDYDRRAIVGKLTLECRNAYVNVYHTGFSIS